MMSIIGIALAFHFCEEPTNIKWSKHMFKAISKNVRLYAGFLSLIMPSLIYAQSQDDSTFNGIDYYVGRIVRGFGGGFEQIVGEKKYRQQDFRTAPFLYGSIGNRLGLRLSNSTDWTNFDNPDSLKIDQKVTRQATALQAIYRFQPGIWLAGTGAYTRNNNNIEGFNFLKLKDTNKNLGLQAIYLSHQGKVGLTDDQRAWVYYVEPYHRLLRQSQESTLRLLAPRQLMAFLAGDWSDRQAETTLRYLTPDGTFEQREVFESNSIRWSGDLVYAPNQHLNLGLAWKPSRDKFQNESGRFTASSGFFNKATRHQFIPRIDLFAFRQMLHRLDGLYTDTNFELSSNVTLPPTFNTSRGQSNQWQANYTFHYLGLKEAPSREAFLADWNGIFGNRLPAGSVHLIGRVSRGRANSKTNSATFGVTENSLTKNESRGQELALTVVYGLSDWLEAGGKTSYLRYTDETSTSFFTEERLRKQNQHTLTLSWANYRYERQFQKRFGWEEISEFDRLHGPLLLGGMINGALAIRYENFSQENFRQDLQIPSPSSFRIRSGGWSSEIQIRSGILDNVELSFVGRLFKSDVTGTPNARTEKNFNIFLAWQPWESMRFQMGRRTLESSPVVDYLTVGSTVWIFQLQSLF
jgi:hypothetical protein